MNNASTINLGFQAPDYSATSPATGPGEPPKPQPTKEEFPTITIPGNKALAKSLKAGQEFTATVTFRVAEISIRDRKDDDEDKPVDRYSGTRVELEAKSMQMQGVAMADEGDGEGDGAAAIDKFFGKGGKGGDRSESAEV